MKLKSLLNENVLGDLPSSKLMKMKWNPITGKKSQVKEDKINEEYIEVMDMPNLLKHMMAIEKQWKTWKSGPATERQHIRPAAKELKDYLRSWFSAKIK
jgi:hypothetical protein